MPRIYLDNAATSWPKPEGVYRAVERAMRELGAPAGRGVYREAMEVEAAVADARSRVGRLVGLNKPEQVIFTHSGTDSLNLALHGLLRSGDHVVTTRAEHNSVLRPLRHLEETRGVEVTRVACDAEGVVAAEAVVAAVRPETRLVAMVHASNVTGALQPVAEVGRIMVARSLRDRENGSRSDPATLPLFLVDAAQTLGHVELSLDALGCDLLVAPGHKGLLGPLGTGVLAIRPGVEAELVGLRQGGTGSRSDNDHQPPILPDKYEPGNHNVPGLLGLGAGLAYLEERGLADLRRHEIELTAQLSDGLAKIPGARLFGPSDPAARVGVVSLQVEGYDPQELAAMLDAAHRIQARAGIHCAPLIHQSLGTLAGGGTLRLSLGPFTTESDIETTRRALAEIAATTIGG